MGAGELVGKDRRQVRGQMGEGREGCRSQAEAAGPQSHRSEEGEEVQGEGQSGGESWAGERSWGERVVGGWDSARWHASGPHLRTVHRYTCRKQEVRRDGDDANSQQLYASDVNE